MSKSCLPYFKLAVLFILIPLFAQAKQQPYWPGKYLSVQRWDKERHAFFRDHVGGKTAQAVIRMNRLLERETSAALRELLESKETRLYYSNFSHPDERLRTGYSHPFTDDGAGLRVVLQLDKEFEKGKKRLLSAIFFLDYDPVSKRFVFIGQPDIHLELNDDETLVARAPKYKPSLFRDRKYSYPNIEEVLRKNFELVDVKRILGIIKKNQTLFPGPDSFRVRVEIGKGHFAGLSYAATQKKKSLRVVGISPSMTTTNTAEHIYKNVTVWARPDHCQRCHRRVGRTMLEEELLKLGEKRKYLEMKGVQDFLKYVEAEFNDSKGVRKLLMSSPENLLPRGFAPAVKKHYRKVHGRR